MFFRRLIAPKSLRVGGFTLPYLITRPHARRRNIVAKPEQYTMPIPARRVGGLQGGLLNEFEDRRLYHPEGYLRPFRALPRAAARLTVGKTKRNAAFASHVVRFANPSRVAVCARRQIRKEVIHANGVAGGRVRPPTYNEASHISCR